MKNAYCILVHKYTKALQFTVEFLSGDVDNLIYIHVDKKSNIDHFNALIASNVIIINDRIDVQWGDFSMVEATLKLLQNVAVDGYCTLLSGDDIPCVSAEYLRSFFLSLNGKNLLHIQDERNEFVDPNARVRIKYPNFFFFKNRSFSQKIFCRVYKIFPIMKNFRGMSYFRKRNITLYKGTQWFSFSSASLRLMKVFLSTEPDYLTAFKSSYCPDEIFFHTLAMHLNLPLYFDKSAANNCLRYIDWSSGPEYPKLLNVEDVNAVSNSKCLFARKASEELDLNTMRLFIRG